jgi:hypothetical protein
MRQVRTSPSINQNLDCVLIEQSIAAHARWLTAVIQCKFCFPAQWQSKLWLLEVTCTVQDAVPVDFPGGQVRRVEDDFRQDAGEII